MVFMTATGHAVIGTVIAAKIGNPALAIPIAIVSHIIADTIPHWDPATNRKAKGIERVKKEAIADVILGFILGYLLIQFVFPQTNIFYAFTIIIAAQLLDWATAPYYFLKIKFAPFIWSYRFQKSIEHKLDAPWGIINQVAVLALLVILAKLF